MAGKYLPPCHVFTVTKDLYSKCIIFRSSHGVNKHISISFGSDATVVKSKPETQDFQLEAGDIQWLL